jgi:hypothetical protein
MPLLSDWDSVFHIFEVYICSGIDIGQEDPAEVESPLKI